MSVRRFNVWPALVAAVILAGCAGIEPELKAEPDEEYTYVDLARIDPDQYRADYVACVAIANQKRKDSDQVISGAVNTALDRASLGILGDAKSKDGDRRAVLKRCLTGRGYNVLR
jgi:hypothetical protein